MNAETQAVLARLRRVRPVVRNAARVWVACRLARGRSPSSREVAVRMGRSHDRSARWLSDLAALGLLAPPPGSGRQCWSLALPLLDALDYAALLDALGHAAEDAPLGGRAPDAPEQVECRACGMPREASKKTCRLCSGLRRRPPGWLDRLVAMAERAERRERLDAPGLPPVGAMPDAAVADVAEDDEAA